MKQPLQGKIYGVDDLSPTQRDALEYARSLAKQQREADRWFYAQFTTRGSIDFFSRPQTLESLYRRGLLARRVTDYGNGTAFKEYRYMGIGIPLAEFTEEPLKSAFIEAALEVKQIFLCTFDPASIVFRPEVSAINFDVTLFNGWEKALYVRYTKTVGQDVNELKHTLIGRMCRAIEDSVQ